MSIYTITPEEIAANNVVSAPDVLEGNPDDNKAIFDRLPELIAERHNMLAKTFVSHEAQKNNPHAVTADQIGALVQEDLKPGDNVIIEKNEDGTVTITATGGGGGDGGDMYRNIYDTNSDGVVNAADYSARAGIAENANMAINATRSNEAGTASVADNGIFRYSHSVVEGQHRLSVNYKDLPYMLYGVFKATTTATVESFMVNAQQFNVADADNSSVDIVVGRTYSFVLDESLNTINFSSGGAALNYKVVGGTTEPINPREGHVWIATDEPITDYSIEAQNHWVDSFKAMYNTNLIIENRYLDSDGQEVSIEGTSCTDYMQIPLGVTRLRLGEPGADFNSACNIWYDNQKQMLSFFRPNAPTEVEVPQGARYLRISVSNNATAQYYCDAITEKTATPTQGNVWIKTDEDVGFSLKMEKNKHVYSYPLSCVQYINDAWTEKTLQIFSDARWNIL